jgi:hypothetical protein
MRQALTISGKASISTSYRRFGEGEGEGEGGSDDGGGDSSRIEAATAGLKAKNAALLREKKALAEQAGSLSALIDGLGGQEGLEKLKTLQATIDKDETLKRINEGKWQEVLDEKTDAMRKSFETQRTTLDTKLTELSQQLDAERSRRRTGVLHNTLLQHISQSEGFIPDAAPDAMARAAQAFNGFDEESDQPVMLDAAGEPVLGKDGKLPITVGEWLESQKEKARHWWGVSQSGGASGSRGSGSAGASLDGLSPAEFRKRFEKEYGK